jgi:hypothetical protein
VKDSESAFFSVQLIFAVFETFFCLLHLVSPNLPFLALPLTRSFLFVSHEFDVPLDHFA